MAHISIKLANVRMKVVSGVKSRTRRSTPYLSVPNGWKRGLGPKKRMGQGLSKNSMVGIMIQSEGNWAAIAQILSVGMLSRQFRRG